MSKKRQTYKDKTIDQWHGVGLGVDCKQIMKNLWEGWKFSKTKL